MAAASFDALRRGRVGAFVSGTGIGTLADVPYGKCLPRIPVRHGADFSRPSCQVAERGFYDASTGVASDVAALFRVCPCQTPKVAFGQLVIDGRRTTSLAKLADVRVGPLQKFMHLD